MLASLSVLLLSYHFSLPSGPAIVLVAGLAYALSLVFGPAGGLAARACRAAISKPERRFHAHPQSASDIRHRGPRPGARRSGDRAVRQTDPVVAAFSILGDMVKRIGGEHVAVTPGRASAMQQLMRTTSPRRSPGSIRGLRQTGSSRLFPATRNFSFLLGFIDGSGLNRSV